MFYATFKGIGKTDIACFQTEEERNNWVNYADEYSRALGINKDNSSFERITLSSGTAKKRIKNMLHKKDNYNHRQEWYCVKGGA